MGSKSIVYSWSWFSLLRSPSCSFSQLTLCGYVHTGFKALSPTFLKPFLLAQERLCKALCYHRIWLLAPVLSRALPKDWSSYSRKRFLGLVIPPGNKPPPQLCNLVPLFPIWAGLRCRLCNTIETSPGHRSSVHSCLIMCVPAYQLISFYNYQRVHEKFSNWVWKNLNISSCKPSILS